MSSRLAWFVLGLGVAIAVTGVSGYLFVKAGGVRMETTARPLPLEHALARMALHASLRNARHRNNPLPVDDATLVPGARLYREHCAVCHGTPGRTPTAISRGMFPSPPQLFEKNDMVTDDPEGVTFWKVTHGIRLSGMPGFEGTLSDTQRWQVTMLVARADRLSDEVRAALSQEAVRQSERP